jgi:hypothetical protein
MDAIFEQKTRKLQNGKFVDELNEPITLTVYTKCPEKYMLVDMETGQKYIGRITKGKSSWKKIKSND